MTENEDREIQRLIKLLEDQEFETWRKVADDLVEIGKPAVLPLIQVLEDSNNILRGHAAIILGNIGDKEAINPIITLLDDSDSNVRGNAIIALGNFQEVRITDLLIKHLGEDEDAFNRSCAADALGHLKEKRAVEALIIALNDIDPQVQEDAAWALGEIGDKKALPALIALRDNSKHSYVNDFVLEAVEKAIEQLSD